MCIAWVPRRRAPGRNTVGIRKLGAVAEGVLGVHQLLGRETVLLHVRRAQVVVLARFAALLEASVVETVVGEFVGVVLNLGFVGLGATAVEEKEHAQDDNDDDDTTAKKKR